MIGCLIIHGFTGGPHELEPLTSYLQEQTDWHISVPTLPGHGKQLALENVGYKSWIETAEASLKQLKEKYDEIYVIGFSMGGMIAAFLAAKYKVDKLVLLATAGKYLSFKQISMDIGEMMRDGITGKLSQNKIYRCVLWCWCPSKYRYIFLKSVIHFCPCRCIGSNIWFIWYLCIYGCFS